MSGGARLHERGYRHYEGPRGGTAAAMRSVGLLSLRRTLGLRRSVWAKIPPWTIIALAFVPALVYAALGALIPDEAIDIIPDYPEFYGFIGVLMLLFAAWAAPEALSDDRRTGMLGIYLASPLDRQTYLLAKSAAIAAGLLAVTLGPMAFLLLARLLAGTGPSVEDLPFLVVRIVVTAVLLAALFGLFGAAVAALADRRPVAVAGVVLVALVLAAVAAVMVETAEYPDWVYSIDIFSVSEDAVNVIWDQGDPTNTGLPAAGVAAVVAAWLALTAALVWVRYRRLDATR